MRATDRVAGPPVHPGPSLPCSSRCEARLDRRGRPTSSRPPPHRCRGCPRWSTSTRTWPGRAPATSSASWSESMGSGWPPSRRTVMACAVTVTTVATPGTARSAGSSARLVSSSTPAGRAGGAGRSGRRGHAANESTCRSSNVSAGAGPPGMDSESCTAGPAGNDSFAGPAGAAGRVSTTERAGPPAPGRSSTRVEASVPVIHSTSSRAPRAPATSLIVAPQRPTRRRDRRRDRRRGGRAPAGPRPRPASGG